MQAIRYIKLLKRKKFTIGDSIYFIVTFKLKFNFFQENLFKKSNLKNYIRFLFLYLFYIIKMKIINIFHLFFSSYN